MGDSINTKTINNREDFILFLQGFKDSLSRHPEEWENVKLPDFLEAMAAYTKDIQGYYNNTGQSLDANDASWKVFTDILMGAKIYE